MGACVSVEPQVEATRARTKGARSGRNPRLSTVGENKQHARSGLVSVRATALNEVMGSAGGTGLVSVRGGPPGARIGAHPSKRSGKVSDTGSAPGTKTRRTSVVSDSTDGKKVSRFAARDAAIAAASVHEDLAGLHRAQVAAPTPCHTLPHHKSAMELSELESRPDDFARPGGGGMVHPRFGAGQGQAAQAFTPAVAQSLLPTINVGAAPPEAQPAEMGDWLAALENRGAEDNVAKVEQVPGHAHAELVVGGGRESEDGDAGLNLMDAMDEIIEGEADRKTQGDGMRLNAAIDRLDVDATPTETLCDVLKTAAEETGVVSQHPSYSQLLPGCVAPGA
ncbi:unnamed protein product [Pedinophyceae sp. YPF-701]|nr:unnamed protein product [Pedinophyceae sp. YPF-701]